VFAEFYYWTRKLQAHFFAGDLVSAVHASLRAVPLLWTSNSFFSSDDRRGHTSRSLSIVLTLGITAWWLAPSSLSRGRAPLDVVKSPRVSYIPGHFYQKIV
jgi:hypothetical protein